MQAGTDIDVATNDLGPLAWVLDELRKSLDSASAALRRFVRDTALARGTDMASVDNGQLRIARQQLHQAVGALEMVGLGAPATMLRSMEAAVQRFVEKPDLCNEASASKVERAGFALTEYLEALLLGKPVSAVSLFPQYKDTQELGGADRVHPADLWALEWRWLEPKTPEASKAIGYDPAVRSRLDTAVLRLVKSGDPAAAQELSKLSLQMAAAQLAKQPRIFWKLCAAYFEAVGLGLLPLDIYVKRAGSRILLQYASLAKGELGVSDRLAQDLVFFASQAVPADDAPADSLRAVRAAWNLQQFTPVDYSTTQYGRFDPVLLSQSRKRVAAAKETWSALSGGDANKLKSVADQFHLVSDSLVKLHPPSEPLAHALTATIDGVVRTARPPSAEIAMEVATAILYLEAAFQDLDPNDSQLAVRTRRLAERLDASRRGGAPEPLEPWMEELYRRVSDRQTMGSVVSELRGTLSELEKLLDQYFRNLADKTPLRDAPGHLSQMRGVLSVLGLDQAAQAVQRMRDAVDEIIVTEIDEERARAAGTFDKLGNNLGALGFLIDMLNYQPALAKKLFVYEEATGELRPLMGRVGRTAEAEAEESGMAPIEQEVDAVVSGFAPMESTPEQLTAQLDSLAKHAVLAEKPAIASSAREAAAAVAHDPAAAAVALSHLAATVKPAAQAPAAPAAPDVEEDDLLDIFLEEAREVVGNGLAAIDALAVAPTDVAELTTLRRAFHTLKGSSRMVGLNEFGEAAWSMEQVLNTWLADQKPAGDELRVLAREAMQGFGRWVEDIAAHIADGKWKSSMFRGPADALRVEGRLVALGLPGEGAVAVAAEDDVGVEALREVIAAAAQDAAAEVPATALFDEPAAPAAGIAPAEMPLVDEAPSFEPPAAESAIELPQEAEPAFDVSFDAIPAEPAQEHVLTAAAEDDFSIEVTPPSGPPASFDQTQVIRPAAAEAAEIPASELPPDFDFGPEPTITLRETPMPAVELPADVPLPEEIEGIDFDSLSAVSGDAAAVPAGHAPVEPPADLIIELAQQLTDFPPAEPVAETPPPAEAVADEPAPPEEPEPMRAESDDQVKVIGSLRIGIPLYNVYLNEADEWSRRLATEVAEWALELNQRVPDSTVGLAHALAGSSATVGFETLSEIARALENSLQYTQGLAYGTPQHGRAFTNAAEEIRRLLHQFAAGFLKDPNPGVVDALHALRDLDIPPRPDAPDTGPFGLSDWDEADVETVEAQAVADVAEEPPAAILEGQPEPEPVAPEPEPAPAVVQQAPLHAPVRTVQAAAQFADDEDEDIDVADAVDPDLFGIFEDEAVELLPQMGSALRQWAARPDNRSARDEVLRSLHTLKGSARLAGALRLGELAHRMESAIESLGSDVGAADVEPLLHRFDGMQANFDALRAGGGAPAAVEAAPEVAPEPLLPEEPTPATPQVADAASSPIRIETTPVQRAVVARPVATHVVARATANQAVRVRSQLLDRLMNQAGEVMITRSRLENELRQLRGSLTDLTGNLDRLRSQLRDIELQAETQMQSRLAQAQEAGASFDPLEFDRFTRVQELTRMMAESVNDVATVQRNIQRVVESTEDDLIAQARQTRELQRDLLRTRMVEFEGISDRLYRVVRLASKESGKQVKLDITGGSIEMDRGVLDRMTPAFEHLLRNCVAHGIEDPEIRAAAGKDASGNIVINLHQEGNDVAVEFSDDGAGLNLSRIREKALQQGLIAAGQEVSDADAAQLIFTPGFSTATQVTELAGRGIGMDVVRAEVNALGGRIETSTTPGHGTTFRLVLPLTTAVTQVVMIRAGNLTFGVPANLIEIVRRATGKEVEQSYNSGSYDFAGETLAFYWCGALLQASQRSVEPVGKTLPVVIFRSAAQRIAVHVDEVLGNQEVVVKNLGPQLARLPGLAGMTVLASGAVVLIYNPVALSTVYGEQARQLSADKAQPEVLEQQSAPVQPASLMPAAPAIPLVLVVDDSITVRRVTQRLLQREGYRVSLAADGLQALERLAEERPTVVLSDIEMPRMDGFDLARNIRGDERMKDLPIIMITSRIAEKHREHAKELGVDHYLGKPYSEEELLSLVKHYSSQPVMA